jgi:hypothetical protein
MNVAIVKRDTKDVIARYEVHKAANGSPPPPDDEYFDAPWQRAVDDGLVDPRRRRDYEFLLQLPKTLYEASQ